MVASTMAFAGFDPLPLRAAFAKSCAAAILVAALLTPTCCLSGAHAHGGGLDGFGPICFARTAIR